MTSLDRSLLNDSMLELEALENETKLLLEQVRNKPKPKLNTKDHSAKEKVESKSTTKETSKPKKRKKTKREKIEDDIRTSFNDTRMTIEVLDDASPDATPRLDEQLIHMKKLELEKQRLNEQQIAEKKYRKLQFDEEKERVIKNNDTFIPGPNVTVKDIENERKRLIKIEESSKNNMKLKSNEIKEQKQYLQKDRSALLLQSLFRGHIGRQKFLLTKSLIDFDRNDHNSSEYYEWIHVIDPNSNDSWYYNKITGKSQYDKPKSMEYNTTANSSTNNIKSKLPNLSKTTGGIATSLSSPIQQQNKKKRTLEVSMSLPSLDTINIIKSKDDNNNQKLKKESSFNTIQTIEMNEEDNNSTNNDHIIQQDINTELGLNTLNNSNNLLKPDGTFKPHLRTVVLDALLDSRFDSVSTVLADKRWYEEDEDLFQNNKNKRKNLTSNNNKEIIKEDLNRTPLVAVTTFNKKKIKNTTSFEASDTKKHTNNNTNTTTNNIEINEASDLTFKHVEHTGFENTNNYDMMCFGCWSSGQTRKCELHHENQKLKPSQTMLLCRNWDIDVMRRRYRSEEIQELFLQRESSLRFDSKHKRFSYVIEQKHPIYRLRNIINNNYNNKMILYEKIKKWLLSMTEELRIGKNMPENAVDVSKLLRLKRNLINNSRINRFTNVNQHLLPISPITGYSWLERTGDIQYLFKHTDPSIGQEVDLIISLPKPTHKHLYQPRVYYLSLSKSIPMPQPCYNTEENRILPTNTYISDDHNAAWIEKITSALVIDCIHAAKSQVKAFTPISQTELLIKTKKPIPNTIKSATIGRKPCPDNMAIGGLALEFLVYQLICTFIPTQYGNFLVMDKSTVSPGVSIETSISFHSVIMPPIIQHHIIRPLEHPLNYRRAPTITLNSNVIPDEGKHFYGINRAEQTGEQEYHGFRTTSWAPMLLTYLETDPLVFVPGQTVVSLNTPKANISYTTHADYTYPFCEPSTRDNSTLDFYHLLLTGVVSPNKPQIFTALTVQEPGNFMKSYKRDQPMGHLVVSVYRSWAFTQRDTIQEFRTDDNIPYWYHRKTGQTFWERPLYEDEEVNPLQGGTLLDMIHSEEPLTMTKGEEGAERRYLQGEFRQQMLMHIETKKDAMNRRKAASITVKNARERNIIPPIPGFESIVNNNNGSSSEFQSQFDFPKQNNSSLMPNEQASSLVHYESQAPNSPLSPSYSHQYNDDYNDYNETESPNKEQRYDGMYPGQEEYGSAVNPQLPPPAGGKYVRGSRLDDGSQLQLQQQQSQLGHSNTMSGGGAYTGTNSASYAAGTTTQAPMGGMVPAAATSNFPGLDPNMINNLSGMIGQMMSNMMLMDHSNPQSMVQLGLGMGMALMSSGAVQNVVTNQIDHNNPHGASNNYADEAHLQGMRGGSVEFSQTSNEEREFGVFPTIGEEEASQMSQETAGTRRSQSSRVSLSNPVSMLQNKNEPIGLVHPTAIYSADKVLDRREEQEQRMAVAERVKQPLNTMEKARNLKVDKATETPDVAPPKILTNRKPSNAEDGLRAEKTIPVLAYPELSTLLPNGPPVPYSMQSPAGLGTSFVCKEEEETQKLVPGSENLRRTVMPLPVGFFEAIEAKHVAQQSVDYLPQVPNLPLSRNIGRVKPRSAAADWMMINFDPWSAGKNPLSTEFIPSLMEKAEKFVQGGPAKAQDTFEQLRNSTLAGAFVSIEDEAGLAQQRSDITKAEMLSEEFKKICSLCRHSKFSDAEQLINQPDWSVPIDFQDDQGNTLLHIVAQNGNKRMVKLCLRRGAALNLQNLTGQTALHFAYGYGYKEVGDYIRDKGADDSIRNKDGLTCYEGLGAKELEYL